MVEEDFRRLRLRTRGSFAAATVFVLALGGLEGWFGKTVAGDVYGSDAVQYLDIARAFERGDVHSALNPLWSQGYPALLALVRPIFAAGAVGEWNAIRSLNFAIFVFSWLGFAGLVRELLRGCELGAITMAGAVGAFVTAQVCMDQVSRVGPDQLVAAFFFLVCTLLLKMLRGPGLALSAWLGIALGVGFLIKAIFLPLGCAALVVAAAGLLRERRTMRLMAPAGALFGVIVLGYGAGLSRAVGAPTLGEAGSLNYAWHVNRLAKWVHWEGGADPADKAWPKPWVARFVRWERDPPDFGRPIHVDELAGSAPTIYVFRGPVEATYAPYFDPPYWYAGYRHVVRWRYQVVALGRNAGELVRALAVQPMVWAFLIAWLMVRPRSRAGSWPVVVLALTGLAIYLPVHLEGRYVAAFFAVLAVAMLAEVPELSRSRRALILTVLGTGFAVGLVKDQRDVWVRAVHGWSYRDNVEWREGEALRAQGLPGGSEIAVISWGPNVQCDWAYLAGLRITSEIASAEDEKAFWAMPPAGRVAVLGEFQRAGAVEVVTRDQPSDGAEDWRQLRGLPMWTYQFRK